MPDSQAANVRIFLLGRFEVARAERIARAGDWTRRKAQTLLARLALEPSHRLIKDQILDLLWPDQPAASANNNLNAGRPHPCAKIGATRIGRSRHSLPR